MGTVLARNMVLSQDVKNYQDDHHEHSQKLKTSEELGH
jgi:hypothetical protein